MVAQGGGAIVNTSSFAFLGDYGGTGYPAGKGGGQRPDAGHRRRAQGARRAGERGVPGREDAAVDGPDYEAHIADLNRRGLLDDVSMQGALDAAPPEYAAPTYAYLASDLAKDVTGQIFIAAGGFVGRSTGRRRPIVGYRDHHDSPPWTVEELAAICIR